MINRLLLSIALLSLAACTNTIKLPLCPSIALKSGPPSSWPINSMVTAAADSKGISLHQLSWFSVEASGSAKNVSWLESNYSLMVCAFDPRVMDSDTKNRGIVCLDRARDWISIIQSDSPKNILMDGSQFYEACIN